MPLAGRPAWELMHTFADVCSFSHWKLPLDGSYGNTLLPMRGTKIS